MTKKQMKSRRHIIRSRSSNRSHSKKKHSYSDSHRYRSRDKDPTRYSSKKYHSRSRINRYSSYSSSSNSNSSSSLRSSSFSRSYSSESYSSSQSSKSVRIITSGSTEKRRNAPHYRFVKGQKIGHKYWIKQILGDGTFGRVLKGEYERKNYAIKIIKPVSKYIQSARLQKDIIKEINKEDLKDEYSIVRVIESFYHRNHYCIVFQQLGSSLYHIIKRNKYSGFPKSLIKKFFYQILRSVGFIHRCGYTHTDLKPENILLEKDHFQIKRNFRGTERYYMPLQTKLKIIDFGSATKYCQHHSSIINTRQYRSPEVLLECCQWDQISDVWSIGCIIVELYTGNLLFDTHQDYEHMAMIAKNSGIFPRWMVKQCDNHLKKMFNSEGQIRQSKLKNYVGEAEKIISMKTVSEIFKDDYQLRDLLNRCLQIDPQKRFSCKQALKHNYFSGYSQSLAKY